jgi:hypothetical protein
METPALAVPKNIFVVVPGLDHYTRVEDVRLHVTQARKVEELLGHENAWELRTLRDFNRFPRQLQEIVFTYPNLKTATRKQH